MSKGLCLYAFETLFGELNGTTPRSLSNCLKLTKESLSDFPSQAPLFITWDKNDNLRGCIGTFYPQSIESGVKRFALTAGLEDPRFPPISTKELDNLSCAVTLLRDFIPIDDPLDWTIGMHGLKLSFELGQEYYSGTFLPSVAEEQNWDKNTTLWYLLRKADYEGISKTKVVDFYKKGIKDGWLKLESYEGLKYTLYFDEFNELRQK